MKDFTASLGFIVGFLIGTLLFNMFLGDNVTFIYLLLVLMGMIFVNMDEFESILQRWSSL